VEIAILGFGREGKAVLKFLRKTPQFKNADISILDKKLNKDYLNNLDKFDIVFRSPGVPYNLPEIQKAVKKGVKFSSATQLFFESAEKIGCLTIGITGTKGKGTTSTLLCKILKAAKKNVYLAGNIGKPAVEILPKLRKDSVVILELSSFQLQDLNFSPDIAVVLNIFPDHLDTHKNFKEYFDSKTQIAKHQNNRSKIFFDAADKFAKNIAKLSKGEKIAVQTKNFELFELEDLKIAGEHNYKNAVMAASVARFLGVKLEIIKKTVKNFRGLRHRLEFVRKINGVKFYNDSASTNPYTAAAAIHAFSDQPKILIAGGKDKNLNYSPLADALKKSNVKLVILFGENKKKIKKKIEKSGVPVKLVKNLKNAVDLAYQKTKSYVLFSPTSASFDMFKDYQDRGEKFKKIIKWLK